MTGGAFLIADVAACAAPSWVSIRSAIVGSGTQQNPDYLSPENLHFTPPNSGHRDLGSQRNCPPLAPRFAYRRRLRIYSRHVILFFIPVPYFVLVGASILAKYMRSDMDHSVTRSHYREPGRMALASVPAWRWPASRSEPTTPPLRIFTANPEALPALTSPTPKIILSRTQARTLALAWSRPFALLRSRRPCADERDDVVAIITIAATAFPRDIAEPCPPIKLKPDAVNSGDWWRHPILSLNQS